MQEIHQIGEALWTTEKIRSSIPEFLKLYEKRPLLDNTGGMKSPHMFATWFMLKKLKPTCVIESGVWKGQGTWLIENTLPNAKIFALDINLKFREYISEKATYFESDFSKIDWSIIKDKTNTLLFFDDHQNAFNRIKQGKKRGFKQFIFEDNYPKGRGDCYSLKKALQHAGHFNKTKKKQSIRTSLKHFFLPDKNHVKPNQKDALYLKDHLANYYEFPPVFKSANTRWGDPWVEKKYPTPPPLYKKVESEPLKIFKQEVTDYTWICFASLSD